MVAAAAVVVVAVAAWYHGDGSSIFLPCLVLVKSPLGVVPSVS